MRKKIFYEALFAVAFFILPAIVRAEVIITEVAWMGTEVSANDEWIELYNNGSETVNLSGWSIVASDGAPNINLSGTLSAGEYGLVERTDDTTYPGISAIHIFTGALGNEGENLSLRNGSTVVQDLPFAGGWPAGEVATKHTMQLLGTSWITAVNSGGGPTTASGDEGDDDDTVPDDDDTSGDDDTTDDDDDVEADDDTEETSNSTDSNDGYSMPIRKVYDDMIFELNFPKRAIAGSPAHFDAQALDFDRTKMFKGTYIFNMGDGTIRTYTKDFNKKVQGFDHTYEHAGSYLIKIKYYETYFEGVDPEVDDTFTIEVSEPTVSITAVHSDGGIDMKNTSGNEINLSSWKLKDQSGKTFIIPEDTVILPNRNIVLSQKRTRLSPVTGVSLFTPTGTFATSWSPVVPKVATKTSSSKKEAPEVQGEVLGVTDTFIPVTQAAEIGESDLEVKSDRGLVYTLLFIILVLISVIGVMVLRKNEKPVEEYELIDE